MMGMIDIVFDKNFNDDSDESVVIITANINIP